MRHCVVLVAPVLYTFLASEFLLKSEMTFAYISTEEKEGWFVCNVSGKKTMAVFAVRKKFFVCDKLICNFLGSIKKKKFFFRCF